MIGASHRWAISLADLLMLLLGMFVLIATRTPELLRPPASAADRGRTPPLVRLAAGELFLPGEAMLRPGAADRLRRVTASAPVLGLRFGIGGDGRRFDGHDLAAARAAALARAIAPAGRIDVTFDPAMSPERIVITPGAVGA